MVNIISNEENKNKYLFTLKECISKMSFDKEPENIVIPEQRKMNWIQQRNIRTNVEVVR